MISKKEKVSSLEEFKKEGSQPLPLKIHYEKTPYLNNKEYPINKCLGHPKYIGKTVISKENPAKSNEFSCWFMPNIPLDVEVGTIVAVDGENNKKIYCCIEDMSNISTTKDLASEFFASNFGNPNSLQRTKGTIIRTAKLRVIYRYPSKIAPPDERWSVRYVNQKDKEILARNIPEKNRILAGFLKIRSDESDWKSWLPIYIHSEWLLGPQGAHMNISGMSGLATKTSYAKFLANSILEWARKNKKKVAIVLFNVKRRDFLSLHKSPSDWTEANKLLRQWAKHVGLKELASCYTALWKATRESGVNPISRPPKIKYFTYRNDKYREQIKNPEIMCYGLKDIGKIDLVSGLFHKDDNPGQSKNFLDTYFVKIISENQISFKYMENDLVRIYSSLKAGESTRLPIGMGWSYKTVKALSTRYSGFINRDSQILEVDKPHGNPIIFDSLSKGINVIQLYGLNNPERRLVVNAVVRTVSEGLEELKQKYDKIIIIMDELNQHAPKRESPIKEQIRDIVSRGRDLKLSLIGAEQSASEIDSQIYDNTATKVVGCTEIGEISNNIYKFLGDLRDTATLLEKGQMILYHRLYKSPIKIWFPPLLHEIIPEDEGNEISI